jgi:hypothetical protein
MSEHEEGESGPCDFGSPGCLGEGTYQIDPYAEAADWEVWAFICYPCLVLRAMQI